MQFNLSPKFARLSLLLASLVAVKAATTQLSPGVTVVTANSQAELDTAIANITANSLVAPFVLTQVYVDSEYRGGVAALLGDGEHGDSGCLDMRNFGMDDVISSFKMPSGVAWCDYWRDPGCLWLGIKDNKDEFRLSNMYGGWLNDAITSIHCSW
ncbi:hypothetical protein BDV98DRAFT_607034 [Pterulicium gracile]|uniref:Uncharacterized protein n=1 Tax=Pterulicium gracile TaxID=1884261 RepID=A0A5C3QAL1_9AGAR|nr:hypothetical protein BDV98DRAFT_607034 [Pterula gracilis]